MTDSKTAKTRAAKTAGTPKAFPAEMFAVPSMEVPAGVREFAEKSIEQAKDGYARIKTVAEDATDMLEDSFQTSRQGMVEINMKALDAAKENTDATFGYVRDLLKVKSFAEAIEVQTAFTQARVDAALAQSKEFQGLFVKVAADATQPAKDVFTKSIKGFSAAS